MHTLPVAAVAETSRPVPQALAALRDSASVGLGLLPLGLAFGVVITHAGLPWWCASLFTAVVYAGSFEFLLVGLTVAVTPLATVALTAFLVNVRHVFYALSFPLDRVPGRLGKAYGTFALTDEAYALTTGDRARSWSGARILWLQLFMQLYWVGGATAGALLGSVVPDRVTGLDFAMTALFAVLALDAVRDRRGDLPTPVLALLSALVARVVLPGQLLLAAFTLFTVALLVRSRVEPDRRRTGPDRSREEESRA
ncbi:AzlC family ABC transporter permease [Streptomyces humi]|uniref:AzlC family ABC transporter permease n=1 Tax=Streptomyces humi TaxID=1428620 RepID=UPI0006288724|nr:AzlC family ABC transporter permease [Streptomyces humi]